jgi:hypothetical protein
LESFQKRRRYPADFGSFSDCACRASSNSSKGRSTVTSVNSFKSKSTLTVGGKTYTYYSIAEARKERAQGRVEPAPFDEGGAGKLLRF